EYRTHFNVSVGLKDRYQLVKVRLIKAEAAHSSIKFDVDYAMLTVQELNKLLQDAWTVYLRLEIIPKQLAKTFTRGVHYHDRDLDIVPSQFCPLVSVCHAEIVHLMI